MQANADLDLAASGVIFHGATWADYEAMLRIVGNRAIRITYDRGEMELTSPTWGHATRTHQFGRMVDTLAEELEIDYLPSNPVTLHRADLEKGAEPDKLYYLGENAPKVNRRRDLDLFVDPPPDLVLEVVFRSSMVPRLPVFAALGIPEVWRTENDILHFLHLQSDGTYKAADRSLAFPILQVADAARFFQEGLGSSKTAWIRRFREFLRRADVPEEPS